MSASIAASGTGAVAPAPRTSRHLSRKVLAVAATALAAFAAAVFIASRGDRDDPGRFVTVPASRGSITQTASSSGTVNPVTIVQVGSYVSGVIQTIACDFNIRVKAGQLCARIDPRPYQTTVDQEAAFAVRNTA